MVVKIDWVNDVETRIQSIQNHSKEEKDILNYDCHAEFDISN